MVAKKIKSKRQTTRHRAKVVRKVAESRRKMRKSSKQQEKTLTKAKRAEKDPGLPGGLPASVKEAFVEQVKRGRELEAQQRRSRQELVRKALETSTTTTALGENSITGQDSDVDMDDERVLSMDGTKRAYYRELRKVMDVADVLLEVVDARDPEAYRSPTVEEEMLAKGKRVILVLNKSDLIPRDVLDEWIRFYQRRMPCVAFSADPQSGILSASSHGKSSDELLQLLKNYCRNRRIKTSIAVGVVGYPNVGKSSLVNALKRSKVCRVGAMPGVTTVGQEVHLDRNIRLLDCPGIVFDSNQAATCAVSDQDRGLSLLRNCFRLEQIHDPSLPVRAILSRCPESYLQELYSIPAWTSSEDFLQVLGKRLGRLRKGGIVDVNSTARAVLQDWHAGKIAYHTEAPKEDVSASILVPEWAPDFQFDMGDVEVIGGASNSAAEEPESAPPAKKLVIGSKTLKKSAKESGSEDTALSTFEASLNPQNNRSRKQALKDQKKRAEKAERRSSNRMEEDSDAGSDYDFNALLTPLPR